MALIHTNPYLKNEKLRRWYVKRSVITSGGVEGIKLCNEKCKLCKEDRTPWETVKELNGSICCMCSYNLCGIGGAFQDYKDKVINISNDLHYIKRVTKLLITRWGK